MLSPKSCSAKLTHHTAAGYRITAEPLRSYFNGIILVSSALNFQALQFAPQNNDPYVEFLPSTPQAPGYHKKLPADLQAQSLSEVVAAARTFAAAITLPRSRAATN